MSARTYLSSNAVRDPSGRWYRLLTWEEGGNYYFATSDKLQQAEDHLSTPELIPKDAVFPPWRATLTEVQTPASDDVYVKLPDLGGYALMGPQEILADQFLQEAESFELFRKYQHPNICVSYGCRRDGDLVGGICLKRYDILLSDAMRSKVEENRTLDIEKILAGIRSGVNFIHSLGLVHNDLHPRNVMLDSEGTPVIIDFDSSQKEGVSLEGKKGGTPGWCPADMSVSKRENDEYSLDLIARFLQGTYDPSGYAYDGHRTLDAEPV